MKDFNGKVLFLDRSNINTDEIIPARYLTELTKEALKPYLLEDLKLEGFNPTTDIEEIRVILTRQNFGSGSSREHAVWALDQNDVHLVIGENFARIFRQNMYNNGLMAVELPEETIEKLFNTFSGVETRVTTDIEKEVFLFESSENKEEVSFSLEHFDRALVEAGGWLEYADQRY